MKKWLSFLLTAILLISAMPTGLFGIVANAATSGTTGGCTWTLDGTELTISGNGAMGDYDYYYGNTAPWGSSVTSVKINYGVTSIGHYAFYDCSSLTSVTIPDSVTSIGSRAFYVCSSLTSITIPDSVTRISEYAFSYCRSLTSITIPDSVTSIGIGAFSYCSSLTAINVDADNKIYSSNDGVLFNKDKTELLCFPAGISGKYVMPNGVTSIGYGAFSGCSSLTSITIPDSVTSIGSHAFYDCSSLTSITIPDSVTSIGKYAFSYCRSLTNITIPFVGATKNGTSNTHFGYIFGASSYSDNSNYVPKSLKTVVITGGTSIGYGAFYNCSSLTSITIPDSVTYIGENAFSGTAWYNNQPDGIVYAGKVLYKCKGDCPAVVTVKEGTVGLGAYAFKDCSSLASITIPDSVTYIGENAFSGTAWYNNQPDGIVYAGKVLYKCKGDCPAVVTVKEGTVGLSDKAFLNCTPLVKITIPNTVTSIGSSAFSGCNSLSKIVLPNKITYINDSMFKNCSSLTSITIPDSVTSIGDCAFKGCSSLTSITIPDSVKSIGDSAFSFCSSLSSISIPNSVTDIGDSAFAGCSGLASLSLPFIGARRHLPTDNYQYPFGYIFGSSWYTDGTATTQYYYGSSTSSTINSTFYIPSNLKTVTVTDSTYIPYGAFNNCSSLTSITIPDSVTSIGDHAFSGCSGLTSIIIPDNVKNIGDYVFYNCSSLITVTIPDDVTSIGYRAFSNCSNLIRITIPDSVISIGNNAFSYCRSLTSITIPDSVISIGNQTFSYCSSLTSITIPDSVISIGNQTLCGCSGLTSITIPFVGDKRHSSTDPYQYPFGYIFGGISYTGGTATTQYYYGSSTSSTINNTFYIPSNLKTVTVTDSTYIPYGAFYNCSSLTSITIPDSVTSIGDCAFKGCSGLTSIIIPDSVTIIGDSTFYNCYNIGNIEIKGNVSIINEKTFDGCSKLENIFLPKDILLIKKYAFNGCDNLKNVYYEGSEEEWNEVAILQYNDILNNATVYCNSTEIPKKISSIEIEQLPNKTEYYERSEDLDVSGGKINVTYDDNTSKIIDISASMVSGFDNTVLGKQTLTVTYGGKTVTYEIEILDKSLMHNFEEGICSICGCKQVSVINAKPATPAFLHNGEYIYDVYNITDSHAANIQLELICGSDFDNTNTYFYIYDLAYNEVGVFTLEQARTETITVNGTTAIIRMVSNKADLSYSANVLINYMFEIGDIDGDFDTNAEDLTLLKKVLLSAIEMKQYQMKNADVNKDGQVDIRDLIRLKKALVDNTVPTDETDKTQENSIQQQEAYLDQKNIVS